MNIEKRLEERFLRYTKIESQSDEKKRQQIPSTPGQHKMARELYEELIAIGVNDVDITDTAIVTAKIPATASASSIGFCAHIDTVDVGLSPNIKAQKIFYNGQDILLNEALKLYFDKTRHPEIEHYKNQDIFFSDGTSVLGADNKAAISVIMTMAQAAVEKKFQHGEIQIAFVPDEEIGLCGAKALDLQRFNPDYAYTIDCCERGEIVYQTFNAASATISIQGVTAHPMSSKGVLVNPILIASELMAQFPVTETPEHTDAKDGYWWFNDIKADQATAQLQCAIRDHDLARFNQRKSELEAQAVAIQTKYPTAKLAITIEDMYANIGNYADENHPAVSAIYAVFGELNIPAKTIAMRGGTDGSALSAKGLVTPNYFTGAHNFHSKYEFLPMNSFMDSYYVTIGLLKQAIK